MSVLDLPPGIGLVGAAYGTFHAPRRARVLARVSVSVIIVLGAITWFFVSRHPYRWHSSTQVVLPVALLLLALLGLLVRSAQVAITRDGVRWGWRALGFSQEAATLARVHIYDDGIALASKRRASSTWFLAARDWDRFPVLVRQVRRVELPVVEHAGKAPFRARLQSYGRFLDGLLIAAMLGAFGVMLWAA